MCVLSAEVSEQMAALVARECELSNELSRVQDAPNRLSQHGAAVRPLPSLSEQLKCWKGQQETPDALLGVVMGSFIEFFGSDAVIAAEVLGIVVTFRGPDRVPMCGVPHGLAIKDRCIGQLEAAGYAVEIAAASRQPSGEIVLRKVDDSRRMDH